MGYLDWLKPKNPDPDRVAQGRGDVRPLAQGYEVVGDDWYTCVPPPGCAPVPAAVEAVRQFDPGAIPIWRVQLWRVPGRRDLMPWPHAGIARHVRSFRYLGHRHLQVQMPAEPDHPRPNLLDLFFEGPEIAPFGPRAYIPWGWMAFEIARSKFCALDVGEFDRRIEARKEHDEKLRAAWEDEIAYRKRHIETWIMRKLESSVGDYDWKQYEHLYRAGARRVKGRKPFVHVRGVAPAGSSHVGSHPAKE